MYFKILGSMDVRAGRGRLAVGGPLPQRVLAMLLLESGRVVPVSRMVDGGWDEEPPSTAAHQVRKAVAELRRRIPGGTDLIHTEGRGYRLVLGGAELDLRCFTESIQRGKLALDAGYPRDGVDHLEAALELWRGPVLLGSGGRVIDESAVALEELRFDATERLIDARLLLGELDGLIGWIRRLIAEQPLREGLRLRLMQALRQEGRSAEALVEYGRARALLADEIGADPGAALCALHQTILTESARPRSAPAAEQAPSGVSETPAAVAARSEREGHPTPASSAPCMLPYDPADFTGRGRELGRLLAGRRADGGGNVRIVAIDGMGGCGKTSLAVRAAHRLTPEYPDGQLYVDMRGFTLNESPRRDSQVISTLLRHLGIPDERIPVDCDDRAALWRATLKSRRVLLVLDNVADCEQIRSLLPASDGCMVILTSRTRLADLDGAELIALGPLSVTESVQLVERVLGAERVGAERDALEELCAACGHVPLALRITTARLRSRPGWNIRDLVDRLRDEPNRLDELAYGGRSIAASFRLSSRALEAGHRDAFRLLPQHPAAEFDVASAAALFGLSRRAAEATLEALVDARLLEQTEFGRYALHDLVRAFALGEQASATAGAGGRGMGGAAASADALRRLLDYYEYAAAVACGLLYRTEPSSAPPSAAAGVLPVIDTVDQAADWFEREWATLLVAVERAEQQGFFEHCFRLARYLSHFLNHRSRLVEFERVAALAVSAARMTGTPRLIRISLVNLAVACWKVGRFTEGACAADEALRIAVELGDRRGEAICLNLIGLFESCLGRLEQAHEHVRRALALHREAGDSHQEVYALDNLSTVLAWLGRHEEAAHTASAAVRRSTELGAHGARISALNDLAIARLALGEPVPALDVLTDALAGVAHEFQPESRALSWALAAEANQRLGEANDAARCIAESRELLLAGGVSVRQAAIENVLGVVYHLRGEHAEALAMYQSAHRHATGIGYRMEAARASAGIVAALEALGARSDGASTGSPPGGR